MAAAVNFPSGVVTALSKAPSLFLLLPDGAPHYPTDPILPPNPIFPIAVAQPLLDTIFAGSVGEGSLSSDWIGV